MKTPQMEQFLDTYNFQNYEDNPTCNCCGSQSVFPSDFRNEKSQIEFGISGACQRCQDDSFAPDEVEALTVGELVGLPVWMADDAIGF